MFSDKLVQRLTGAGIADLVLRVHDARNRVFEAAEKAKADPQAKGALEEARRAYALSEAALEKARAEHQGLVTLTQLLAAMTSAGKDTNPIRLAMVKLLQDEPTQPAPAQTQPQPAPAAPAEPAPAQPPASAPANGDGTETGTFTVLEVRLGKSLGTVRAYCQAEDGNKYAIYAKNGNGQALAGAVGKTVNVKYRRVDKGLWAVNVQIAG
ncbi:MAG: hypothetical protein HPY89_00575 [Pelotomaculum sp.]|nr:hypothetical protein [Pelotomaculum sp.]